MKNTYSYLLRWALSALIILCAPVINADDESTGIEKPGKTFAWMPSGNFFYDAPRFRDADIKSLLEGSIISELEDKGYKYSPSDKNIDFYISYIVVLEEKLSESDIANILKEYPELNQVEINNNNFEHGTFIISAFTSIDRNKIWKNSLNDVVYLQMPEEIRQQRLQESTKKILESFSTLD